MLYLPAFAQQTPGFTHFPPACGPAGVNFSTETSTERPPVQPEAGKALVYVVDDFPTVSSNFGAPRIKVGLDGTWMGAAHGSSYLFFSVGPGEHHMCATWQSSLERFSKLASFAHVVAEAGKTYYFRTRIIYSSQWANVYLDFEAIDPDEGEHLVALYPLMASHAKK